MENFLEDPFKFLKAKDNSRDARNIVRSWYIARDFVINKMHLSHHVFEPDEEKYLHVVIPNDSPRMLFVARQVVLMTHFLNYDEDCPNELDRHRTIVSIVSDDKEIKMKLEQEDFLCNLPKYCKFVDINGFTTNEYSYIDIEIHIVGDIPQTEVMGTDTLMVNAKEVDAHFEMYLEAPDEHPIFHIDTRNAFYSTKVYNIGATYSNIPAEDIHCTSRYSLALSIFRDNILNQPFLQMFDDEKFARVRNNELGQYAVKTDISNILCADCFEIRKKSIEKTCKNGKATRKDWADNNEMLSRSEHARWVVEKLVLGYRPLSFDEKYCLEGLHVEFNPRKKKKKYLDRLKKRDYDPAHVDICSYAELRRTNPEDLKYDSFLMLAIPFILDKTGKINNTDKK